MVPEAGLPILQKGFSLIELLVVIAIIAILSSLVYPSYQAYTCNTYKGQASIDLRVCAMRLEQYYSEDFSYRGAVIEDDNDDTVCSDQSPVEGQKKFTISLSVAADANSYTLQATPVAGQSCGNVMELTAAGVLTGQ